MGAGESMKAVYLTAPGAFELREVPVPAPRAREVLVAVKSVGICGSDIHYYEHGRIGEFVVTEPIILGHECAGEVVEVGPEVQSLGRGDVVALEPGVPCRRCARCLSGRYNLCPDVVFMATPPHDGAFCQYVAWPEDFAYRLPAGVSAEVGATAEPLAVGLHAARRTGVAPGERVAVLGAGPIGLLAVAAARAAGAGEVAVTDLVPMRLAAARQMGASRTLKADEEDVSEELGDWADVVLDCVGCAATLAQALEVARAGGRVAWVGMAADAARLAVGRAQAKELAIAGVFRYANVYPAAVSLLGAGRIDPRPLITHRFGFPQVAEAVAFAAGNRRTALKTMVNFG